VSRLVPEPTRTEKLAALRAAIGEANRLGITSVHSVNPTQEELQLLDEIRKDGDLSVRVYASIAVSPSIGEAEVLELNKLRDEFPDDPALKLGGISVVCPCDAVQVSRAVALLDRHGWQVMVQTEDGADVRAAVDAFERVATAEPSPERERRSRIDESLLADGQARILSGSNWPAASLDPRDTLEDTVAGPGELRNAIDAYTTHAAYASYDEHRKGTLARGMLADIVILSNDIFETRPEALRETAVTVTIVDGKIVYQRPPAVSSND
jgi:predicted amidohydrolase YtcJ